MVAIPAGPFKVAADLVGPVGAGDGGFSGRSRWSRLPGRPIIFRMRMPTRRPPPTPPRPARHRSKFGYDHRWWGEAPPEETTRRSYWSVTRRPLPCLAFVAPLLLAYELGVLWLGGGSAGALRTGADAWMRQGLAAFGMRDHWLLPFGLIAAMLAWQACHSREWRFPAAALPAMAVESLLLAVALVGLSKMVDLGFDALEHAKAPALAAGTATITGSGPSAVALVGFLGAGVYEEALFRLALIPLLYGVLRCLLAPRVVASVAAVTASSLLFALAHHAGTPGEAFTWFAFIFRWLAGVYFAWVFVVRGFGVAVGTHTAYDLIVGWLGWHL